MSILATLAIGAAGSVLGAAILALSAYFFGFGRTSFRNAIFFWRVTKRMKENGLLNFFATRSEYVRYRQAGTICRYLDTARHDVGYVGFWLAHGVEMSDVSRHLSLIVRRGIPVEIVLLNPDCAYISHLASYINADEDAVVARIKLAISNLESARDSLPADDRHKFRIKLHNELLTASAFVLDRRDREGRSRLLVDYKIHGHGRDNTYGLEFCQTEGDSLANRLSKSYLDIASSAPEISSTR